MYDSDKNIEKTGGYEPPSINFSLNGMSGLRAYVYGIRRGLSRWKTVTGLYLAELSWVFLFSLPVYFVFRNLTAKRPAGEGLITSFDIELLSEIFMDHPVLASSLIGLILAAVLGYFIISAFFIGGLIGTEAFIDTAANKDKKTAPKTALETAPRNSENRDANNRGRFAEESIKRGPRLLLIHILYMIPGLLFFFILMVSLELGSSLGDGLSHSGRMLVSILSAVPALALITLWDTSLDFSRVWFVCCHPRGWRGLLRGFGAGWVVLWRRGAAAVILHIGFLALSLIVSLVMLMVFVMLNMVEAFPPLITFLIVQIFAFLRTFVRSSSLLAHHAFIVGRK